MRTPVELEDIERLRLQAGIDDVELRLGIRGLRVGDYVNVTLLTGARSGTTSLVRITHISRMDGTIFQGRLVRSAGGNGRRTSRSRLPLTFTATHIHSLAR